MQKARRMQTFLLDAYAAFHDQENFKFLVI